MFSFVTFGLVALVMFASAIPSAQPIHRHHKHGNAKRSTTGKRGLAYNDVSLTDDFVNSPYISWAYNWGSWESGLNTSLEYVPMLWGASPSFTNFWNGAAQYWLTQGSTHLLSFNEPDLDTQANLTVAQAIAGFQAWMQPFASKAKLGSPAVTNGGGSMGLAWLQQFLKQCTKCQIDFVAIHWYSLSSEVDYFKQHIQDASAIAGGKPVWLTEFGITDSGNEKTFLQEVLPWLDNQTYVQRYAYFGVFDGLLVNSTMGKPSSYGHTYKHFPGIKSIA